MRLYLCRHGDAVDARGRVPDAGRWLTAEGRAQADRIGRALAKSGDAPQAIRTSPLARAVQTACGVAHACGFTDEIVVDSSLAGGNAVDAALEGLVGLEHLGRVMLVGHEPDMGEWSAELLGRPLPRAFGRACVLAVDFDGPPEPGLGRAAFFLDPADLVRRAV